MMKKVIIKKKKPLATTRGTNKIKTKAMTNITVTDFQGTLVVDSRLVAEGLGIKHKIFMDTIRKYQIQVESAFGTMAVETASSTMGDGRTNPNPEKFYYLSQQPTTKSEYRI